MWLILVLSKAVWKERSWTAFKKTVYFQNFFLPNIEDLRKSLLEHKNREAFPCSRPFCRKTYTFEFLTNYWEVHCCLGKLISCKHEPHSYQLPAACYCCWWTMIQNPIGHPKYNSLISTAYFIPQQGNGGNIYFCLYIYIYIFKTFH